MKRLLLGLLCVGCLCGCNNSDDIESIDTPSTGGSTTIADVSDSGGTAYNQDKAVESANKLMKLLKDCNFKEAYQYSYGKALNEDDMPTDFQTIYNLNQNLKNKKRLFDYGMNGYNDDESFEDKIMSKIQKVTSKYANKIIKDYKVSVEDGEIVAEVSMMSDDTVAKWFEDIEKKITEYGKTQGTDDIYETWKDNVLSKVWKDSYLDDLEKRLKDSYKTYHIEFEQNWNDAGTEATSKIYSLIEEFDY